ncbi:MAG: hypothetical protein K8F91_14395 [Candidatus Obscuribacterales bacterium]|nr:hypothetical protein [Candidatus Obscuribacterales bacterium]
MNYDRHDSIPSRLPQAIVSQSGLFLIALFFLVLQPVQAKKYLVDSPLTIDQQKSLNKAAGYAKRGKSDRATPIFNEVLDTCNDLPKCLALAGYTEQYGHPLLDVRRAAMKRAFKLCRTHDDYIQVALKSRQFECYDVTRNAIQKLIGAATSKEELTDLARKAQEVSLNDVAHLAMEKEYQYIKTVPDALEYARQVSLLGMEDLLRQVVKELIDDENDINQLLVLLKNIEGYKLKDMDRYLLKKTLDLPTPTTDTLYEIWKAGRRHRQQDIMDVAVFRAKKQKLTEKMKEQDASKKSKLEKWRQGQFQGQGPNESVGGF